MSEDLPDNEKIYLSQQSEENFSSSHLCVRPQQRMFRCSCKYLFIFLVSGILFKYFALHRTDISTPNFQIQDRDAKTRLHFNEEKIQAAADESLTPAMARVLNNTPPTTKILMYNNVPKCGSTSMVYIIKTYLQRINHYFKVGSIYIFPRTKRKEDQIKLIDQMLAMNKSSHYLWASHTYFFDDVRDYSGIVSWMNIVRDPVERFISDFYFERQNEHGFTVKWLKTWGLYTDEFRNMNLDDCAAEGNALCTWTVYPFGELQLSFFCGQEPACRELGKRRALQLAMNNVEKYYSVVGITEERRLTYAVLEAYLPKYFGGLANKIKGDVKKNVSTKKESVKNETRILLKNNFKEDYEFYEFIKQRLYAQAEAIGIDINDNYDN